VAIPPVTERPALSARRLRLGYDGRVALRVDELDVPTRAVTALIGPNGSGKSTLLHAAAGLVRPLEGDLRVLDEPPRRGSGRVALVPQTTAVDPSLPLTVRQAVSIGRYGRLGLARPLGSADRRAVDRSMTRLGIAGLARRQLRELSGGERQRVLVAQGLAQEAPLLLLDEPITGLDVVSKKLVITAMTVERAAGRTVVFATHDLHDASLADTVVLLAGRVVAAGTPEDVLTADHLASAYRGRFVRVGGGFLVDDATHHDHGASAD